MASVFIRKPRDKAQDKGPNDRKIFGVYMRSILDTKVTLAITEIGKNVKPNLEVKVISKIAGKCITDGFIKPNSIKIISYSSGMILAEHVEFHVVFECMVCLPVEGMLIECTCKTITKAGIHAQVIDDEGNMPVTVFVARDHHHLDNRFNNIKEGGKIAVRVIGIRYELNDQYICVIAKLAELMEQSNTMQKKPKLSFLDGKKHGGTNEEEEADEDEE